MIGDIQLPITAGEWIAWSGFPVLVWMTVVFRRPIARWFLSWLDPGIDNET